MTPVLWIPAFPISIAPFTHYPLFISLLTQFGMRRELETHHARG